MEKCGAPRRELQWCGPKGGEVWCPKEDPNPEEVGTQRVGAPKGGREVRNFALFSLSRRKMRSFLPSLGVILVVFEAPGRSNVHVWSSLTPTRETPLHETVKQVPTPHGTHTTHHTQHTTHNKSNSVWPKSVLAKVGLAKVGFGQTRFWPKSVIPLKHERSPKSVWPNSVGQHSWPKSVWPKSVWPTSVWPKCEVDCM